MAFNHVALQTASGKIADIPETTHPVLASGITTVPGVDDTNEEITVVAGTTYIVTVTGTFCIFGFLTTGTAANVIYVVPANTHALIHVPIGVTSLHVQSPKVSGTTIFLRKVTR